MSWLLFVGVGVYATLSALSFLGREVNGFDECLQLLGGRAVLEGKVPHKDFWTLYPPLNYYLNAIAFRMFGVTFLAARFVAVLSYAAGVAISTAYIHHRLKGESVWLRGATIGLAVFVLTRVMIVSQVTTTLAAATFLILYSNSIEEGANSWHRRLLIAGVFTGVLLIMRLNVGVYLAASVSVGLLIADDSDVRWPPPANSWSKVAIYSAPVCFILAVYLLSYAPSVSLVIDQIARAPNQIQRAGHILDVSHDSAVYRVLVALAGLAAVSSRVDCGGWRERRGAIVVASGVAIAASLGLLVLSQIHLLLVPYLIPALLFGAVVACQLLWRVYSHVVFVCLCFLAASTQYYLIRADSVHVFILSAAAGIVATVGIVERPRFAKVVLMACLLALMLGLPVPFTLSRIMPWLLPLNPKSVLAAIRVIARPGSFLALGDPGRIQAIQPLSAEESRFFPEQDELATARYLGRAAAADDSVFVGLTSHDRTRVNNARLSWILPRPLATRYLELEPGIITSERAQREIVAALDSGVRWLVLEETVDTGIARYPFSPSNVLDHYIVSTYSCNKSFGRFHVCCRNQMCP
jgi:hypothetical protein